MAGVGVAFLAEVVFSFLQMSVILRFSNNPRLAHFTGLFAGATEVIEHVDRDLTMAGLVELYYADRPQKSN
jgi:hypothetical protein